METERRNHPRFNPLGLQADITLEHPEHGQLDITGEVIDISYTGIKIRLNTPIAAKMDGRIKIQLILPQSGIPLTISGIIKHQCSAGEYGLHYADGLSPELLDAFIFECIKSPESG